jgi:LysM repeat protein
MRMQRNVNTCGIVAWPPVFPTVAGELATISSADLQPAELCIDVMRGSGAAAAACWRSIARALRLTPWAVPGAPPIDPDNPTNPPTPPTPAPGPDPGPGPGPSPPTRGCSPTYTVQAGDTIFRIAQANKVSYLNVIATNPQIANPDLIMVGDVLTLPCPPPSVCKATVVVNPGDSLWAISNANGVTLQDLVSANPQITTPDLIYPGDTVNVPPCSSPPEAARAVKAARTKCVSKTYTAKLGDYPYK